MSDFYRMDPADWDFGTANLSLEEEAAYLRIVNAIHKHKGPVPNNDRVLAGMFRVSTRKARSLIDGLIAAGKITIEDGKIWNERARSDLVQRGFVSNSRAESGAKGGRTRAERAAKALKTDETPQAIASPREEKSKVEKRVSSNEDTVRAAISSFNDAAARTGWPEVKKSTPARVSAVRARIKDVGGIDGWNAAIRRAEASDFLCGRTDKAFFLTFDFVTTAKNFAKLIEGNYDNRKKDPVPLRFVVSDEERKRTEELFQRQLEKARAEYGH